ncbi:IS1 family transposase, partial [Escherichia coli]|uniref:IS1 family transposase n=1 Tax=Escherichia coli TaxID=562 RepID=UPI00201A7233
MASVSISCPSCSATDGVVRNGKSTAGHQRYLCSHCRKTWQLQFTYTASQPGTHQKIIDMAMNGVGCRAMIRRKWKALRISTRRTLAAISIMPAIVKLARRQIP